MNRSIILSFILTIASSVVAQTTQPLFMIERSKNVNKLYYEAQINADGNLEPKDPVKVHWILWARDPSGKTREGLNFIERTKVYGFNIKPDSVGTTFRMTLKPFRDRLISVYMQKDTARAEMLINGRRTYFKRLFIYSKGDSKPDSIRLYGSDIETRNELCELFLTRGK